MPPSTGSNRLLYLAPLVLIVAGAGLVVSILRKWSRKGGAEGPSPAPAPIPADGSPTTKASRDDLDDKLDDELRRMDR